MHFLIIAVLIIAAVVTLNMGVPLSGFNLGVPKSAVTQTTSNPSSLEISQGPAPFQLDTRIVEGPENESAISQGSVSFKFTGSVFPEQEGSLRFETRVLGLEDDWKETSSSTRSITLPAGPGEYTLQVRSKLQGYVDETPAVRVFRSDLSPDFGKVRLSSVSVRNQPFSLRLSTSLSSGQTVNITGWTLSSRGGSFPIGQGVERFHPTKNTTLKDIVLKSSDQVIISGVPGPFGRGVSFRPNVCFGYLKSFYTFPVSVPSSCPDSPRIQDVQFLSPDCQEFILYQGGVKTSSCKVLESFPSNISTDSECVNFIQNRYNYDACYTLHSQESNFDKSEWHVYETRVFGGSIHDTIKLLDKNGLLVNQYVY